MNVYLEIGKKKTFASAVDWPGWCRSARNEQSALLALYECGPRYAKIFNSTQSDFAAPLNISAFNVVEQLEGNATTDFGAPGMIPSVDTHPVDDLELERFQNLLKACWKTLDLTAKAAVGQELRKGPRGGGRDLETVIKHILAADLAYLKKVGWSVEIDEESDLSMQSGLVRQAILTALSSAVSGEMPTRGPRGGLFWPPRYFVRRVAWHVLDHVWEIEDRMN